jgi:hypothetical protein
VVGVAERVRHEFTRAQQDRVSDRVIWVWYEAANLAPSPPRRVGFVIEREIDVRLTVGPASCHGYRVPDCSRFQSAGRRLADGARPVTGSRQLPLF